MAGRISISANAHHGAERIAALGAWLGWDLDGDAMRGMAAPER
jgi:hypothetical protein